MLKIKNLFIIAIIAIAPSCNRGPSDADLQKQISSTLDSGITATVNDKVVTLSGTCPDESCKNANETAAKNIKGVKSVVNNISVTPVPVPQVEITADDSLKSSLNLLAASYKTVKADVNDGVVTLSGEIKRSQLTTLMQSVNELKPKRVENKLVIK